VFSAFVKLRFERPDLERPYRVPVNSFGALAMVILPVAVVGLVLSTADSWTWVVSGGVAAAGPCIQLLSSSSPRLTRYIIFPLCCFRTLSAGVLSHYLMEMCKVQGWISFWAQTGADSVAYMAANTDVGVELHSGDEESSPLGSGLVERVVEL
jgi:hypothetical protein